MRPKQFPPWIWSFCWAMLPAAVTALVIGGRLEPTHALSQSHRPLEMTNISALHTSQALQVDTHLISAGAVTEGDDLQAAFTIHNIWRGSLALEAELENLPGWSVALDRSVLEPGESTVLRLSGLAGTPGDFSGRVRIRSMGDFLNMVVEVEGSVTARPIVEAACTPAPDSAESEPEAGTVVTETASACESEPTGQAEPAPPEAVPVEAAPTEPATEPAEDAPATVDPGASSAPGLGP